MKYTGIKKGCFIDRPNRFIAHVEIDGEKETVHVKNTGRCRELLLPGVEVYVQRGDTPGRKTKWDLISVRKGDRIVNIDSQLPNQLVKEWLLLSGLFPADAKMKQEVSYQTSRFDLYVEYEDRKIFIEVKGVTLEDRDMVSFPDAPSERAVKHVKELCNAVKDGYEAYVLFVVQMSGVRYFTPNAEIQPTFCQALREARQAGVQILAYECEVQPEQVWITKPIPVVLEEPQLYEIVNPLVEWYRVNARKLPWREHINAYHTWVSEIMLQQTRVEAVKPFYHRFLEALPTVADLAAAHEDELLKLWEGLGYYNRVRNMQQAAVQIMEQYDGNIPHAYEEIRSLKGIGSYTAGAISSIAYGIPKPAVDGNVLRVVSRILGSDEDITKASVKAHIENALEEIIPIESPGDFNQGLIELGALICIPNGAPRCSECPAAFVCRAKREGRQSELPVKKKKKARSIEQRTVLLFLDGENLAIKKRPEKGLLAGLYEFPNILGHLSMEEVKAYAERIGLKPIYVKELPEATHIFSHIEWQMKGYAIRVDELAKSDRSDMLFIHPEEISNRYAIPSAFEAYTPFTTLHPRR